MANEPMRNPEQNQPGQEGGSKAPGRDQDLGKREGAGQQGDAADRADRENPNNQDVE